MRPYITTPRKKATLTDPFGEEWEPTGQLRMIEPSVGPSGEPRKGALHAQPIRLQQEWVCTSKRQGTMWRDVPVIPERFATA
jgi:hypothetical protein